MPRMKVAGDAFSMERAAYDFEDYLAHSSSFWMLGRRGSAALPAECFRARWI